MAGVMKAQSTQVSRAQQPPTQDANEGLPAADIGLDVDHEALPHGLNSYSGKSGRSRRQQRGLIMFQLESCDWSSRWSGVVASSEEMGLGKTIDILRLFSLQGQARAASAGSGERRLKANECHGVARRKGKRKLWHIVAH